MRNNMLMQ